MADNRVCGCKTVRQSDYRGTVNVSGEDGSECLRWDSDVIKAAIGGNSVLDLFPDSGLESNYCRNLVNIQERRRAFL